MKIALISDTHFGARNDSLAFLDYFAKFYDNVFFPYLDEHNIRSVVHLGDVVDRRKFINYHTLSRMKKIFLNPLVERKITTDIIVGNHDTFWRNTSELNSMRELFGDSQELIRVHDTPSVQKLHELDVLFMPWISPDFYDQCVAMIQNTSADVMFCHAEIQGFGMYRGIVNYAGMSPTIFSNQELVLSGHFHHKSRIGNIQYLGSPYEITWSDCEDIRGFHVFDTKTREVEFVVNPYQMFRKIKYDDSKEDFESLFKNTDFNKMKDSYVKVLVMQKKNPYWFDLWLDSLYKASPHDVVVVDVFPLNTTGTAVVVDETKSTLDILVECVDSLGLSADKPPVIDLIRELYAEAMSME